MAISARMQALIKKVDDADAAHFAALHERGKQQADARAKQFEKQRANLRMARAVQGRARKKRAKKKVAIGLQPTRRA